MADNCDDCCLDCCGVGAGTAKNGRKKEEAEDKDCCDETITLCCQGAAIVTCCCVCGLLKTTASDLENWLKGNETLDDRGKKAALTGEHGEEVDAPIAPMILLRS